MNNGGYTVFSDYVSGYYKWQSPTMLHTAALMGRLTPRDKGGVFRYCEIGCGTGLTSVILAAANPNAKFTALDFNSALLQQGKELAAAGSLSNIDFICADVRTSFLPDDMAFDYVTAHGFLSWVDPSVQEAVFDFIATRLEPDGLAMVSYNALPGCAGWAPLPALAVRLRDHRNVAGESATLRDILDALIALEKGGARYFKASPLASEKLARFRQQDERYVAHEVLNDAWNAQYCSDMIAAFERRGLAFVASADLGSNIDDLVIPRPLHDLVGTRQGHAQRELVRSIIRNEYFRYDIFTKPAKVDQKLPPVDAWASRIVGLSDPTIAADAEFVAKGKKIKTPPAAAAALIQRLQCGACQISKLPLVKGLEKTKSEDTMHALFSGLIDGSFRLYATHDLDSSPPDIERSTVGHALNRELLRRGVFEDSDVSLASTVYGGGVFIPSQIALCLWALDNAGGRPVAEAIAARATQSSVPLGSSSATADATAALLDRFTDRWLPFLARLRIVEAREDLIQPMEAASAAPGAH